MRNHQSGICHSPIDLCRNPKPKTSGQMETSVFDESHLGHCGFDPDLQHDHFYECVNDDRTKREPERTRNVLTRVRGAQRSIKENETVDNTLISSRVCADCKRSNSTSTSVARPVPHGERYYLSLSCVLRETAFCLIRGQRHRRPLCESHDV